MQLQGWETLVTQIVNDAAQLPQRIDQIADRPLVHASNARQLKLPAQHGQSRRQGSHGCARVAHKKLELVLRQTTAQPGDTYRIRELLHSATQLLYCRQHDLGIVGRQQVVHGGRASAQRC